MGARCKCSNNLKSKLTGQIDIEILPITSNFIADTVENPNVILKSIFDCFGSDSDSQRTIAYSRGAAKRSVTSIDGGNFIVGDRGCVGNRDGEEEDGEKCNHGAHDLVWIEKEHVEFVEGVWIRFVIRLR